MPFRLLHIADLHLDRAFAGMGCHGDLARRRRQGLRDCLRRSMEEARRRACAVVTVGGDLYEEERADPETGRFLAETFAAWQPLRVVLAPGNHDALMPGSLYARTDWPANVHLFTEPELRPLPLCDGLTLWGLAHREPAWMGDPLAGAAVGGDGGVHLALFHGAEMGSRPEGKSIHGPFRAERIAEAGFAGALCGHYHRRRIDPAARLVYPGSPEPLAFDEDGGRGPVLVEVGDDGVVTHEPLSINVWTAVSTRCQLVGVSSFAAALDRACASALAAVADSDPACTMLRIELVGEMVPEVPVDLPTLESHVAQHTGLALVRARDLTSPAIDIEGALADPTTRGLFTRELIAAIERSDDASERTLLGDALRFGLEALGGVEVGLR